ncbi:hypothetical protein LF929_020515 [Dickeya oryzae]|uniref:D-serine dehydratase n=1 Tax=Dickeya oryzae TaxID=1240404 RepID=A0AB39IS42_9GAMM|nr:hypothetical protein [Dickeya oryzae]MCA6990406.1 hypothetical protein [Dickeya oryzae]
MTGDALHGKTLQQWFHDFPLLAPLVRRQPVCWFNPAAASVDEALGDVPLTHADVTDASQRLQRFAPFLQHAFSELQASGGIIESKLVAVPTFAAAVARQAGLDTPPSVLLKLDSHLPVAGSVKARGGIYEVLFHAEQLALGHGLLREDDDYRRLLDDEMLALLHTMHDTQQILLEPSALAGAPGFLRLLQENQGYRQRAPLTPQRCQQGTHVIWATGGGMVPPDEMAHYLQAGAACRQSATR